QIVAYSSGRVVAKSADPCGAESSQLRHKLVLVGRGARTPDTLIKNQGHSDQHRTLTESLTTFEARLLFLRHWKMYVLPRFTKQAQPRRQGFKASAFILPAVLRILISRKVGPYLNS